MPRVATCFLLALSESVQTHGALSERASGFITASRKAEHRERKQAGTLSWLIFSPLQRYSDYLMYRGLGGASIVCGMVYVHNFDVQYKILLYVKKCSKTFLNRSELHIKFRVRNYLTYQTSKRKKNHKTTHTLKKPQHNPPWRQTQLKQVLNALGKIYFCQEKHTDKEDIAKALRLQQIVWVRHQKSCSSSNLCFPAIL